VDKTEAAEVVNEDGGAFVALLSEFVFQLYKIPTSVDVIWSTKMHSPGFGCNKDLVVGLGFLALPRKLCHCTEQAANTLGRQHLGELLQNLAVECKLFEPWKKEMTEAVMPSNELGLLIGGR
jgi:hypothetical protein